VTPDLSDRPDRPDRDDTDRLDAWSALVAVYQAVLHDVVRALETEAGLDSGVFSALAYLARAERPGRIRLGMLQELMHPRYSQPGLSRLVQRMEADGLVERRADPDDGRAAVLVMTRAGRARFTKADTVYTSALRAHFGRHLSGPQARALRAALQPVTRGRAVRALPSRTVRTG
jgi:DNA-binding MarR family transcriptional regulator